MEETVIFVTVLVLYILFVIVSFWGLSLLAGIVSGRGSRARKGEESDIREVFEEEVDVGGHKTPVTRRYSVAQLRQRRWFRVFYVIYLILWWQFYEEVHAVVVFLGRPIVALIVSVSQ